MDDRIPGYGPSHSYYGPHDQEQLRTPRPERQGYSSARDYAAAGEYDRDWRRDVPRGRDAYGQRGDYQGERYRYDLPRDPYRERGSGREPQRGFGGDADRDFFARAGDEVRSWFGDEDAERRRERDARYDAARE